MHAARGMTLLGIPPAGVGASFFHPIKRAGVPIQGIDLPGRESRTTESACGHLSCAVDDAANQVGGALVQDGSDTLLLAGHSFGAVIAWLVAVQLAEGGDLPERTMLVLSGAPGPTRRRVPLAHLPDNALVATVARLTGYTHPAYENPVLRAALLPALRSDLACLTDVPQPKQRLDVLVRVIRGAGDPVVQPRDARGWERITCFPVRENVVPGGHMHPAEDPHGYAAALTQSATELLEMAPDEGTCQLAFRP